MIDQATRIKSTHNISELIIRSMGVCEYLPTWNQMLTFSQARNRNTPDEIWVLEHLPVFTQGQAGKPEHLLATGDIPVVKTDRGGQVTYHGPGQLVIYLLIDLRRLKLGVRSLVTHIESAIIATLQEYGLNSYAQAKAPGVYIEDAKIAALGLRIHKGCSYHGLSLNISCDLTPFQRINPCGYAGLKITRLIDHIKICNKFKVTQQLLSHLTTGLCYSHVINIKGK